MDDEQILFARPETTEQAIKRTKWRIEDLNREFIAQKRRIEAGEQARYKNFDPLDIGREEKIIAILKSVKNLTQRKQSEQAA